MLETYSQLVQEYAEIFSTLDGREWELIYDEYVTTAKARCNIASTTRVDLAGIPIRPPFG
jgi:hypothetical protein